MQSLIVSAISAMASARYGPPRSFSKSHQEVVLGAKARVTESLLNPQTYWYDAEIDHFDSRGAESPKYKMRYLVDQTYWNKETGPVIFYAGNEGDVWTFFDNSGFMTTTLAQQFGALVVFGEHRYFGESMPFGD